MDAEQLDQYIARMQEYSASLRANPPKTDAQIWEEKIAERQTQREVEAIQAREAAGKAAWENYDAARQPGGLFANLTPTQDAQMVAELLVNFGERPPAPNAYDLAAEMVDKKFEPAFVLFEANLPALSARLDAIPSSEVANRIAATKRALGEEILARQGRLDPRSMSDRSVDEAIALGSKEHARLVEQAKAGIEPSHWNDVVGADLMALKAFASHGRNYAAYEAALAALPRRKAA